MYSIPQPNTAIAKKSIPIPVRAAEIRRFGLFISMKRMALIPDQSTLKDKIGSRFLVSIKKARLAKANLLIEDNSYKRYEHVQCYQNASVKVSFEYLVRRKVENYGSDEFH